MFYLVFRINNKIYKFSSIFSHINMLVLNILKCQKKFDEENLSAFLMCCLKA